MIFSAPLNDIPSGRVDVVLDTLHIEPGSRSIKLMENGRYEESFRLFSPNSPPAIMLAVKHMRTLLELAKKLAAINSFDDEVQIFDKAQDEQLLRVALVYGGTITAIDHQIVRSDLSRGAALFAVTIERSVWEHHGQIGGVEKDFLDISGHGGYRYIDTGAATGDVPARIKSFIINPLGYTMDRAWMGFKAATAGRLVNDDQTARFDPTIKTYAASVLSGGSDGGVVLSDTSFIEGNGIYVSFHNLLPGGPLIDTAWRRRWEFPIDKWNTATATTAHLPYYLGEYYLLLRYKTSDIGDAKIGIRAATGYRDDVSNTYLDNHYLTNTDGQFRYLNLGKIRIGGEGWTTEARNRTYLSGFRIKIDATLIDGDYKDDRLYLDNMYLVPADHYIYVKLGRPIAGGARIELYQQYDNTVTGYVTARFDDDGPGPLPVTRQMFFTIDDIKSENWGWPVELGSAFVIVSDREEPNQRVVAAVQDIKTSIARRSVEFSE